MFAALNSFLTGALAKVTDVYWPFVSMLLHGDSAQQFNQDTSTNVFPITAVGAVQASTLTPFTGGPSSYGSGYFNGSSYLTVPDNAAFNLAANDFTVECWAYFNSTAGNIYFAGQSYSGGSNFSFSMTRTTAGELRCVASTPFNLSSVSSAGALSTGLWYHIVYTRNGNTIRQYINGVQNGTANSTGVTISNSTGVFGVGSFGDDNPTQLLNGYISNFRLVNGTCLYPNGTTFTPPTVQLTAVTNTALLTLQTNVPQNNNQFFDTSTNNFIVTRNGNTTQGSFNPFVSTYPYAVATNGGSAYFDGTGDSLTVPDNAAFTLGTNDFTIECWINFSSLASQPIFTAQMNSAATIYSYYMVVLSTGQLNSVILDASTSTTYTASSAAGAILVNTWYHVAFVRNGNTNRQYINGVQAGTVSVTGITVRDSASLLGVGKGGEYAAGQLVTGYISNFRLVNGTCLYPSGTTFTPPTAPLTAVTNTALLLGMSNAAIFDNAILNNLETVANAQISTSTFKYGTGALKFNGTTDYLPTPTKTAFVLGTGDFTIECWVYSGLVGNGGIAGQTDAASTPSLTSFYLLQIGTALTCTVASGATNYNATATLTANAWNHVAFVRDGATLRAYVGGVQGGTGSITTLAVNTSTYPVTVGRLGDTALYFNGYIDDFRFTKGICRYPSGTTFIPPTAAFPNQAPANFPGAPTIGTATASGASSATVAFTQPASNGGSVITSYTATSNPSGITGTLVQAGSGTITVNGLAASTSYTFTVRATNANGSGFASAASNSITTSAAIVTQRAIFGYGYDNVNIVSMSNLVSNTGVVATDTTGVGSARSALAASSYGTDKAIFGFGYTTGPTAITNLVSNTGVVATDTAGVGTARYYASGVVYGGTKAIIGFGTTSYGGTALSMTNLVSSVGVVATDTTGVGTANSGRGAAGYGSDRAIFGFGMAPAVGGRNSITNLVSNTGVVATDTTGVGTVRDFIAATSYDTGKAIFGFGFTSAGVTSLTNLVSDTGVVATDTTGVGTARQTLAASPYGGDKGLFGFGFDGSSAPLSMTNKVSNTGVVATDTTGVGTARFSLAAAGYSST